MNNNVRERLKSYIKHLGIKVAVFERSVGLTNGYVANIRQSISPEKIEQILRIYPNLNTRWLMTGEGEMERVIMQDKKQVEAPENKVSAEVLLKALEEVAEQRKLVSRAQDQIDQLIQITKTMAEAMQSKK